MRPTRSSPNVPTLVGAVLAATLATLAPVAPTATAGGVRAAEGPADGLTGLIAVGAPERRGGAGAVQVFQPDGRTQNLTPASLQVGKPADVFRFGQAVAVADLNADGAQDLVVGAPWADSRRGRAWIILSIDGRFSSAGLVRLAPTGLTGRDYFGFSVAVSTRFDDSGHDIWVGAPGNRVGTKDQAGAVLRFRVGPDGLPGPAERITQDKPGVPDVAEAQDWMGEVLAPARNGVVIGVPDEDVGSTVDAGAVIRLRTNRVTNEIITSAMFNQNSPGVAGTPQQEDLFGGAVSADGLVVGTPGDRVNGRAYAGSVQIFAPSDGPGQPAGAPKDSLVPLVPLTQNAPGIPGVAEADDRFGTSVDVATFSCAGVAQLAIGAPGERLSDKSFAGSVTVAAMPGAGADCPAQQIDQFSGSGAGVAEAFDSFGWSLGVVPGAPGDVDQLLIGVPGESIGSGEGTGQVVAWRPGGTSFAFGDLDGNLVKSFFGLVLARTT